MKNYWTVVLGSLLAIGLGSCSQNETSAPELKPKILFDVLETPIGDLDFAVGCVPKAAKLVERGVALTHHMMYEEANFVFGMADDVDPNCAMAYWGQAMTIINPLWPNTPSDAAMARGKTLVEKALSLGGHTARETAYLQTTASYFSGSSDQTEGERLVRFEQGWRDLSAAYKEDIDAQAFFILASLATADPSDRTLTKQKQLGRRAQMLLDKVPNHPGAHHYLIHAYDYPELAPQALPAANHYGEITPRVPHAVHMMTHIYTRLGLWDEAIEWNDVSAQAALSLCLETGEINGHYTHALDYLAYAHLQKGEDAEALKILETTQELKPPYSGNLHTGAYAFSAIPARLALETRDWKAATRLTPRSPGTFPWSEKHDPYVAITHFARAIGWARLGQGETIGAEIEALSVLRDSAAQQNPYWAKQIDIQIMTAEAWRIFSTGEKEEGISAMRAAARLAATTEKHAITPGEALPAMELLGDMLFEAARFEDALAAYQRSLTRTPHRLNSLYGAAQAAERSGDLKAAKRFYSEVVTLAGSTEAGRASVLNAQKFMERN